MRRVVRVGTGVGVDEPLFQGPIVRNRISLPPSTQVATSFNGPWDHFAPLSKPGVGARARWRHRLVTRHRGQLLGARSV